MIIYATIKKNNENICTLPFFAKEDGSLPFFTKEDALNYLFQNAEHWKELVRTHFVVTNNEFLIHVYADDSIYNDAEAPLTESLTPEGIDPDDIEENFSFDITIETETGAQVFEGSFEITSDNL